MNDPTLLQACRLLFGDEVIIGEGFLDYLQPGGLKNAFRQQARQTHPDSRHPSAHGNVEAFHAVQQAFQVLTSYLEQRDCIARVPAAPMPPPVGPHVPDFHPTLKTISPIILDSPYRPRSSQTSIDRLYEGTLPERTLLFGHFLYYSGLTTWRTITSILVQQQRDRPRFGELGTRFGMLRPEDIPRILGTQTSRRPFGEVAVALGLLSEQQLANLLRQQKRQQKKFGAILVEKELITLRELTLLLTLFRRHNRAHGEP
ncbi:MAG: J domain-containing protein [Desulfobulbus sp.]